MSAARSSGAMLTLAVGVLLGGCSGGEESTRDTTREYEALDVAAPPIRSMFSRAFVAGGYPTVLQIDAVETVEYLADLDYDIVRMPGGVAATARVLSPDASLPASIELRLAPRHACGIDHAGTHICVEPNFPCPDLAVGEVWQVATQRHSGANEGYWTLMAGRRLSSDEDVEAALADAVSFAARAVE